MAVITISRQHGSGGTEIATRVSTLLNYGYFDKNLMALFATELGILPSEVVDFSEDMHEAQTLVRRMLRVPSSVVSQTEEMEEVKKYSSRPRKATEMDAERSIPLVESAILAAYRRGNVVILGRGGQSILKDKPGVLHVRVVAPHAWRVQRLQEREKLSYDAAQVEIAKRDWAAADYLKRYYRIDGNDPVLYHLVVNTGLVDPEKAAQMIVNALP
jgi:cytidylate kinase